MKKNDLILIIAILILAGGIFSFWRISNSNTENLVVRIYVEDSLYYTHPLTADLEKTLTIETDFGKNIVNIKDGVVDMIEADCPDQVCVDSHAISNAGESLVCLPHQVFVDIVGDKPVESEVDASAY